MLKITVLETHDGGEERVCTIEESGADPSLDSWLGIFQDALRGLGYARYELDVVDGEKRDPVPVEPR